MYRMTTSWPEMAEEESTDSGDSSSFSSATICYTGPPVTQGYENRSDAQTAKTDTQEPSINCMVSASQREMALSVHLR
eukprot:4352941-Amphidinium_carterae.1